MPFLIYNLPAPQTYGNFPTYLYGLWLNAFLVSFVMINVFRVVSDVKIPWWFYLLLTFSLPNILDATIGGQLIRLVLFTVLLYLLIVHRNLSYNRVIAYYLLATTIFITVEAIVGPILFGLLGMIWPTKTVLFHNYGANILLLVDWGISLLILKKFKKTAHEYVNSVADQRPILSWVVNLCMISFYFVKAAFHYQLFKLAVPQYVLIALLYLLVTIVGIKLITQYLQYKDLSVNQAAELQNLAEYTSHVEAMDDDLRRFRHDYKNLLLSLDEAIEAKDMNQVSKIYHRVIAPSGKETESKTSVLSHLGPIQSVEIKSVVYSKVMAALQQEIKVEIEVEKPLKPAQSVATTDLVRIISILFDNAINAAKQAPQPRVNFTYFEDNDHNQVLIIGNSTKQNRVDLEQLERQSHFSLNNGRHGLGLRNLRQILAKYPQVVNNRSSDQHWFEQELIIHQS